ncbi:MAG: protein-glutamate O-methyltransferase CheR [Bacteroidetes bacterium]|nr:protein-glutamate O-methyltransferase CheR [Bacteroidota bacterium]
MMGNPARQVVQTPIVYVPTTLKLSDEVFRLLRDFIYQKTGIYFQDTKKYLLEGRIGKRIQLLDMSGFDEYLQLLRGPQGTHELPFLYEAVTINETYFFRNEPQFDVFERILIPEIITRHQYNGRPRVRIWSAASSSGEEAYTVALIYLERLKPKYPLLDIEIIGTDINNAVLDVARAGVYSEYSIRNVPRPYLDKYFEYEGGKYYLADHVKQLVRFEHLNLYDRNKMRRMTHFDVVFCCNVLIYFDMKSKIQVVSDIYDAMNSGGYLFIGYAETLHGISSAFKLINFPKTVVYKKE